MSNEKRSYIIFLQDMLYAMQKIQSFIEPLRFDEFKEDEKTQDAVIRNFEIIVEAANQIPKKLKSNIPKFPEKKCTDSRILFPITTLAMIIKRPLQNLLSLRATGRKRGNLPT